MLLLLSYNISPACCYFNVIICSTNIDPGDTNSDYPYCDVFTGLPEDDQADQGSDILFEMSDTSFIPCYCLALEKGTR